MKRLLSKLSILLNQILIVACLTYGAPASANDIPGVNAMTAGLDSLLSGSALSLSVKKGEPYDPAKDPALRKGTENEEQPQGSFFVVPAVVLGIVGIILFFNRKDDL